MKIPARNIVVRCLAQLLALMLALLVPYGGAVAQDRPAFSQQQLEQTLAPVALYPDPLLSQILMASTYPLEVVEAARWSRSHANLIGEDAVRAAETENWDPSVKSLLAFPQVLARMDENLQWLQALGDAFLGQEQQVMDTVQILRRRAQVAGNLHSDERQRVVETGPSLVIQPADPRIIYVPYYDPRVVYGSWWWPDHAPVYWRPFPGYYAWPGLAGGFYWGPSIRISVGYFFGGFDWPRRHVRVVQTNYYYSVVAMQRTTAISRDRPPGSWTHDPVHRRGVAYRGTEVRQRFADPGTGRHSGNHPDRGNAHRQDHQRAQSYPSSNRHGDAIRPAVHAGVQSSGSTKVQPASQPLAPPYPASGRQGEPHNDVRRAAVQPAREAPVQAAIQQVPVARSHSDTNVRAQRREQSKDAERGERRQAVESRQATRPANAVPQTPRFRGNAPPAYADRAEPSVPPHARESNREPRRSPAGRQETQREAERPKEVQGGPEARPGSGWQRRASTENVLQQPQLQR